MNKQTNHFLSSLFCRKSRAVFETWFLLVQCGHWVDVAAELLVSLGSEESESLLFLLTFYHNPTNRGHQSTQATVSEAAIQVGCCTTIVSDPMISMTTYTVLSSSLFSQHSSAHAQINQFNFTSLNKLGPDAVRFCHLWMHLLLYLLNVHLPRVLCFRLLVAALNPKQSSISNHFSHSQPSTPVHTRNYSTPFLQPRLSFIPMCPRWLLS